MGHTIGRREGAGDGAAVIGPQRDCVKGSRRIKRCVLAAVDKIREALELLSGNRTYLLPGRCCSIRQRSCNWLPGVDSFDDGALGSARY